MTETLYREDTMTDTNTTTPTPVSAIAARVWRSIALSVING